MPPSSEEAPKTQWQKRPQPKESRGFPNFFAEIKSGEVEAEELGDLIAAAVNDARKKGEDTMNEAVEALGIPPDMLNGLM